MACCMAQTMLPSTARAQGESMSSQAEDIVVTAQRLANRRAVAAKREANAISDVLAADDLNELPDQNLAEAMSRVPGLTAFQDEGAGLYIGMRGLNQEFVNLTMDGLEASSPSRTWDQNLRGANLEAVPSSLIDKVEVIKSATPDLDGDAIAGTVNLVTRSALDKKKSWLSLGGSGGYYEEDVPPDNARGSFKGNLSAGHAFGPDRKFGIVLDANVRDVHRDNLKPYAFNTSGATADVLPQEVGGYFYQRHETSYGVAGKLEFRPSDQIQGYVGLSYFDSETRVDKNKHALYAARSDAAAGTFTRAQATVRNDAVRYGVDGALTATAGIDVTVTDRDSFSVKGSTASSASWQDDPRVDWFYSGPLGGTYDYDGTAYTYELAPASYDAFVNPSSYSFNGYRHFQERLEKDVHTVRADWERKAPETGGLGFKLGGKWKETSVGYTSSYFRWRNPVAGLNLPQFLSAEDYSFPGTSNARIVLSDIAALSAYVEGLGETSFARRESTGNGNDYQVRERVAAAYALLNYTSDRLHVVGGVRYEATDTRALNRFNRVDDGDMIRTAGHYEDFLPSLAVTFTPGDSLLLRFGASRTIGRPDIRDLARGETPPKDNGVFERGNPDLRARRSTNIDAAAEYYFDGGRSLISVTGFHKEIRNEIFDLQTPYTFTNDLGDDVDSYFVQPTNAGRAHVTGVEFGLMKDRLDFLPGPLAHLGVSANVTFNSGRIELLDAAGAVARRTAPPGMSRRLANATLFYEDGRLSARLAWRHVSRQTQELSINGAADLIVHDYQQLDAKVGLAVIDGLEIIGEVWNLANNKQRFTNANKVTGLPNWYEQVQYGRAWWLGFKWKM